MADTGSAGVAAGGSAGDGDVMAARRRGVCAARLTARALIYAEKDDG